MFYVVLLQWIVLLFHILWIHVLDDHPSADEMSDFLFVNFLNDLVILLLHSLFFSFHILGATSSNRISMVLSVVPHGMDYLVTS